MKGTMGAIMEKQTTGMRISEGLVKVATGTIELDTPGDGHVSGITDKVTGLLRSSGLSAGTVTVFVPGATGAVTTLEFEPGVVHDLQSLLDTIIPPAAHYAHNDNLGDGNGHSHVRAGLLGPSLVIPFSEGRMTLGRYQEIAFCDFDARPRSRRLVVQITGV